LKTSATVAVVATNAVEDYSVQIKILDGLGGGEEVWLRIRHKRDANEAKFDPTLSQSSAKNRSDVLSTLRQACDEFGRPDLEETMSWIINLEPRNRNIQHLLASGRRPNYSIAANVMMYEGKVNQARDYFNKALELTNPNSHPYQRTVTVLSNLDDVVKIARRYWELNGKGKVSESEDKSVVEQSRAGLHYTLLADAKNAPQL
jgi:tetratricopeptide (TPR) repeat protein